MEYIRETLERQRAALWLLMLGGRNETPPEERRETARPGDLRLSQESPAKQDGRQALPAEQGARESRRKDASRAHREQRAREEAAPADEGTEERPGKRDGDAPLRAPAAWEMLEQALLRRSARRWKETVGDTELAGAGAPAAPASSARRRYPPAEADRAGSGSSGQPEEIFVNAGAPAVTWRTDGREGAEAKALSQAFQRDARRYDGGFRLY